jgi:ubiquinone/menaquinone biosynthesis C-methylase UbiE
VNSVDYALLADEYARHRQVHPGVLRALCGRIGEGSVVLEVGCGTGNYVAALTALSGCRVWGIDPSTEMLARAQRQLNAQGSLSMVQLSLGQGERLGVPDGQFDLVYSVDVIHHIQDRAAYLRQAHRALVPGGQVCTATDSEWIIRHREPLAIYWPETIEVELERYPRIRHLETLYREYGFEGIARDRVEHRATLADAHAYRDKAFSSLHLISESAFQRGLARLERDLCSGPVPHVSRYTLLWGTKR